MSIALLSLIIASCIAYVAYCAWAERSDAIDAHTRQHREKPKRPCPWCEAARPTLADQLADLDRRITEAREKDQAVMNEVWGLRNLAHNGGTDEQQAEYADAAFDAELARLLGEGA